MRGIVIGMILGGLVFVSVPTVRADSLVSGKEALSLLGDLEQTLSRRPYSVIVLNRRDHQPAHLDPIDAILFQPGKGGFEKIRTQDRDHRLILNSPAGRAGESLTPDLLKRLISLIRLNHMVPHFVEGEMEGGPIIFTDPYNRCWVSRTSKGTFVSVQARSSYRQKTLEENAIWFRKY